MLPGKIGIRIPSHNSLTPSFLDELLKTAATSRKIVDSHRIRRRLPEKYHIAIVSTGLSYLAYLGALKKVHRSYKPSRLGKKIGKLLAKDQLEEANVAWSELLTRHRLFGIFKKYFASKDSKHGTIEDFGLYLRKRAHAKWNISAIRSRVSRLCELFADKGLIEYQNGDLSPINIEHEKHDTLSVSPISNRPQSVLPAPKPSIKMEIKIEISDKIDPKLLEMILSFLKDMKGSQEVLKIDIT